MIRRKSYNGDYVEIYDNNLANGFYRFTDYNIETKKNYKQYGHFKNDGYYGFMFVTNSLEIKIFI